MGQGISGWILKGYFNIFLVTLCFNFQNLFWNDLGEEFLEAGINGLAKGDNVEDTLVVLEKGTLDRLRLYVMGRGPDILGSWVIF